MTKLFAIALLPLCLLPACVDGRGSPPSADAAAPAVPDTYAGRGETSTQDQGTDEESTHDAQDAVEVIHEYYRAIAERDFDRAYRAWGSAGPPEQTRESFEAGFADTKSAEVRTGEPSRVEPAAGSRYVQVPVTIVSTTTSGAVQRFEGTYTLRRSVVDGAPPSDRTWHLHRASIRAVP